MRMTDARQMRTVANMKVKLGTKLSNITRLDNGSCHYNEELVWSKWIAEPNTQPSPFVEIIQTHLSDDLNPSDSTRQHEISSDQPTDEEGVQTSDNTPRDGFIE